MSPDLVVVGGGPVGLGTALYAARSGLGVVLLEPREGNALDKACGEGLMPGGVAALEELGVRLPGRPLLGVRYVAAGRRATADFRSGLGRGVRRTELHAALRRAVEDAGVEVLPVAADGVEQDDAGVTVRTRERQHSGGPMLRARYLVAADGLHSPLRAALGLQRPPSRLLRYGQRRHFQVRPWSQHVEVHWAPHAEAYVTPVGDDLVGVAVLSSQRAGFAELLAGFPELLDRLADATAVTATRGAGPLRQRSRARTSGRVLLVGDASGYVDALTGEGISLGLAQAQAAVRAIAADRPRAYERGWRQASWRYAAMTHLVLQATRPSFVRRAIVPAADALPAVFTAAVDELGRVR